MCKDCKPGGQQSWDKLSDKICGFAQTTPNNQDAIGSGGDNKVEHPEGCECMQTTSKGQTVQRVASVQQGSRHNNNVEHQPCSTTQSPANSNPDVERQLCNSGEAGEPAQAHNHVASSETSVAPEAISDAELQMANPEPKLEGGSVDSERTTVSRNCDSLQCSPAVSSTRPMCGTLPELPVASVAVISPEVYGRTQLISGDGDVYVAANVSEVDVDEPGVAAEMPDSGTVVTKQRTCLDCEFILACNYNQSEMEFLRAFGGSASGCHKEAAIHCLEVRGLKCQPAQEAQETPKHECGRQRVIGAVPGEVAATVMAPTAAESKLQVARGPAAAVTTTLVPSGRSNAEPAAERDESSPLVTIARVVQM